MLGWVLFDRIIAEVDGGETINPWRRGGPNGMLEYQPWSFALSGLSLSR